MESLRQIAVQVLKGIIDVKGAHPEGHGKKEQDRRKAHACGINGNPARQRGQAKSCAQPVVAERRHTLEQAVGAGKEQGRHGKPQAEAVDSGAGRNKDGGHDAAEGPCLPHADGACDKRPVLGARIFSVDAHIRDAVEGHGKGTHGHHGDGEQKQGAPRGQAARRKNGSGPGVGQRKDGVLNLDHPADIAEVAETGVHGVAPREAPASGGGIGRQGRNVVRSPTILRAVPAYKHVRPRAKPAWIRRSYDHP